MERDDKVAEWIDLRAVARLDNRCRVELLDDGGTRDGVAWPQCITHQDGRVDPFAREPDAPANAGGSAGLHALAPRVVVGGVTGRESPDDSAKALLPRPPA